MVSLPARHAGDPGSIPDNGAKGGENAMSFTKALPHTIPHSHMPNALFVAHDNSFELLLGTVGHARGRVHIIVVLAERTRGYCRPYADIFTRHRPSFSGIRSVLPTSLQSIIVVRIPAYHAGDPGSISGNGAKRGAKGISFP